MDSKKSNKIREIVRLQQILKKWRKVANSSKTTAATASLVTKQSLSGSNVPKGYLSICVGEEQKRFIIPTAYLGHQAFHVLLREAEEEFGFQQTGILRIPCEVSVFENILRMVEGKKNRSFMEESAYTSDDFGFCSSETESPLIQSHSHHPQSPMCR